MSTTAPDVQGTEEDLQAFVEAAGIPGSVELVEAADGNKRKGLHVDVTLIREGFGNQRDNHYYGAGALREALPLFQGGKVKMYINHLDAETKRRLGGLPRPVEHHGARLLEAWLHENPEHMVDEGGRQRPRLEIRGRALISHPLLREIVEADPEALGTSIDARGRATDAMREGRPARDVTQMTRVLSTDFVTEAGANGKIDQIVEAFIEAQQEAEQEDLFELATAEQGDTMPDSQLERDAELDAQLTDDEIAAIEAELEDVEAGDYEDIEESDEDIEESDEYGELYADTTDDDAELEEAIRRHHSKHAHHRARAKHHRMLAKHHRKRGDREKALHHEREARKHEHHLREAEADIDELEEARNRHGHRSGHGARAGFSPVGTGAGPPGDITGDTDHLDAEGGIEGGWGAPSTPGQDHRQTVTGRGANVAGGGHGSRHLMNRTHGHNGHRKGHLHKGRHMSRRHHMEALFEAGDFDGVEELVTEMAASMADQVIEETLEAGLAAARDEFERQLAEAAVKHDEEVERIRQSYQAAAIIDSDPSLPEGAKASLKESFYERRFTAREENGTEVPAEQVLREAVTEAIQAKKGQVEEFREARVTGMGATATASADGVSPAGRRRRRGGLDDQLDKELGIPSSTTKEQ